VVEFSFPHALGVRFYLFHILWHPGCVTSAKCYWMLQFHWCWSQCPVVCWPGLEMLFGDLLWCIYFLLSCFGGHFEMSVFSCWMHCSSCIPRVSVVSRRCDLRTNSISSGLHPLVPFWWWIRHLLVGLISIYIFALFSPFLRVWH